MTDPPAASATSGDADLIAAVRAGDAEAYGILYERHSPRALRLARQITGGEADADDVVAETFAKVLAAIKGGSGPTEVFVPYLLTAVRRVAFDHVKGQRAQVPTDDAELTESAEPFVDPAEASLERTLIAGAFAALPERWSAVLWHTEVEQAKPAEVALLLGISANSVAALRYRAREGLRQAYLQMHLSQARPACQPVAGMLGGYVRGALSRRDAKQVDEHLGTCADCEAARAELDAINGTMRGVLAPVILGGAAAGYLAHGGQAAAAGRWFAAASRHLNRVPWHRAGAQAAAAVAVAAIAITVTLAHPHGASPSTKGPSGAGAGWTCRRLQPIVRARRPGRAWPGITPAVAEHSADQAGRQVAAARAVRFGAGHADPGPDITATRAERINRTCRDREAQRQRLGRGPAQPRRHRRGDGQRVRSGHRGHGRADRQPGPAGRHHPARPRVRVVGLDVFWHELHARGHRRGGDRARVVPHPGRQPCGLR